jgi:hypothetical protein
MFRVNQFNEHILIFEVKKKFSTGFEDLYSWNKTSSARSRFTLDILKAKDLAQKENIFYHIERQDRKICFMLFQNFIYIIGSEIHTQFQLLEAIIEEASQDFAEFYKNKIKQRDTSYLDENRDFDKRFEHIIGDLNHIVSLVLAHCDACGETIKIIAKNSILNKPDQYIPVPLVFTHKGHSLLIYLDKNFSVRGTEIVDVSS